MSFYSVKTAKAYKKPLKKANNCHKGNENWRFLAIFTLILAFSVLGVYLASQATLADSVSVPEVPPPDDNTPGYITIGEENQVKSGKLRFGTTDNSTPYEYQLEVQGEGMYSNDIRANNNFRVPVDASMSPVLFVDSVNDRVCIGPCLDVDGTRLEVNGGTTLVDSSYVTATSENATAVFGKGEGNFDSKTMSSGIYHTLAIANDFTLWAWGANSQGQLGSDWPNEQASPIKVSIENVRYIAAGNYTSFAIIKDGSLYAWGSNNEGVLGAGLSDAEMIRRTEPKKIMGIPPLEAIATSGYHAIALDVDGNLWSWGENDSGQLGYLPLNVDQLVPKQIDGSMFAAPIVQISAGLDSSFAVTADGKVWSWGKRDNGRLGDNGASRSTPQVIAGLPNSIIYVSSGTTHSIALTSEGTLWGWGGNTYGQVGNGTSGAGADQWQPVPVINIDTQIVQINTGRWHSMAIDEQNRVWTWGYNTYAQIGNGNQEHQAIPNAYVFNTYGLVGVVAVDGGENYTVAILSDGNGRAWGRNLLGFLGRGTTSDYEPSPFLPDPVGEPDNSLVDIFSNMEGRLFLTANPSDSSLGIQGVATAAGAVGVAGFSSVGAGVIGDNTNSNWSDIAGISQTGVGVYGINTDRQGLWGGYFNGRVESNDDVSGSKLVTAAARSSAVPYTKLQETASFTLVDEKLLAADGSYLWTANGTVLTQRHASEGARYSAVMLGGTITDVMVDTRAVWVTADKVYRLTPGSLAEECSISLDSGGTVPQHLAFDGTYYWVTAVDASGKNVIIKLNAGCAAGFLTEVGRTEITNDDVTVTGIAYDGTYLWLTAYNEGSMDGQLISVNPSTLGALRWWDDIVGRQPSGIVFDNFSLWVANRENWEATRLIISDTRVCSQLDSSGYPVTCTTDSFCADEGVGYCGFAEPILFDQLSLSDAGGWEHDPGSIIFDGNDVWLANQWSDDGRNTWHPELVKISPTGTAGSVTSFSLSELPNALAFDGRALWLSGASGITARYPGRGHQLTLDTAGMLMLQYSPDAQTGDVNLSGSFQTDADLAVAGDLSLAANEWGDDTDTEITISVGGSSNCGGTANCFNCPEGYFIKNIIDDGAGVIQQLECQSL